MDDGFMTSHSENTHRNNEYIENVNVDETRGSLRTTNFERDLFLKIMFYVEQQILDG